MRKIAIYRKRGHREIDDNPEHSRRLGRDREKIMIVGCNPKADSTRLMLGGLSQKTVLDTLRAEGEDLDLEDVVKTGAAPVSGRGARGQRPAGHYCLQHGMFEGL